RSAESQATVKSVRIGRIAEEGGGRFDLPTAMPTRIFGTLRGTIPLSVHDEDGAARVAWAPHLRLPGLRAGEQVHRIVLTRPTRAQILGADGRPRRAPTLGQGPWDRARAPVRRAPGRHARRAAALRRPGRGHGQAPSGALGAR